MRETGIWLARLRSALRCESGSALIEMSAILPVLLILLLGGAEFARALAYHHTIEKAARDTGRYLARLPSSMAFDQARAKNYFLYGAFASSAPSTTAISAPGKLNSFNVESALRLGRTNVVVKAEVEYTFDFLSFVGLDPALKFKVNYEQPYIGE